MHRDTGPMAGKALMVAVAALALAGMAMAQATPRFGIGIRVPGMRVEMAQLPQAPPAPQQFATGFAGPEVMAVRPFRFRVVTGAPYEATATAVNTERLGGGHRERIEAHAPAEAGDAAELNARHDRYLWDAVIRYYETPLPLARGRGDLAQHVAQRRRERSARWRRERLSESRRRAEGELCPH